MRLPNGTLWRKFNLGATSPEESGVFASWGNTDGHREGEGYDFSQEVYDQTPGAALTSDLSLAEDIARVSLGGSWVLPSADDFAELVDNCTSEWTTLNGVRGRKFTSPINGKSIFLPAAGYYDGSLLRAKGTYGSYWSRSYLSATSCRNCDFNASQVTAINSGARHDGFSIRPIIKVL